MAFASRAAEIAGRAAAVLSAPETFWNRLPPVRDSRAVLANSLEALWQAEQEFFQALASRLELLVRKQAYERQCWELLSAAPVYTQTFLNLTGTSPELDSSIRNKGTRLPTRGTETEALRNILLILKHYPEKQKAAAGLTIGEIDKLLKEGESLARQGTDIGKRLRGIARKMRLSTRLMEEHLARVQGAFHRTLFRGDLRWVTAFPAAESCPFTMVNPNPGRYPRWLGHAPSGTTCSKAARSASKAVADAAAGLSIMAAVCLLLPASAAPGFVRHERTAKQ